MAVIEKALFAHLIADSTVVGLVEKRIYPNMVPQSAAMPAITYQQISGVRDHVMAGAVGLVKSRYQINCWAASYSGAKDVSEAVRKQLDGYSGTIDSCEISCIMLDNENDIPQVSPGSEKLTRYGKYLDFIIWYKESTV